VWSAPADSDISPDVAAKAVADVLLSWRWSSSSVAVAASPSLPLKSPWLELKLDAAVEVAEVRAAPSPPLSLPLKQSKLTQVVKIAGA
jgi:hypothetical protein